MHSGKQKTLKKNKEFCSHPSIEGISQTFHYALPTDLRHPEKFDLEGEGEGAEKRQGHCISEPFVKFASLLLGTTLMLICCLASPPPPVTQLSFVLTKNVIYSD